MLSMPNIVEMRKHFAQMPPIEETSSTETEKQKISYSWSVLYRILLKLLCSCTKDWYWGLQACTLEPVTAPLSNSSSKNCSITRMGHAQYPNRKCTTQADRTLTHRRSGCHCRKFPALNSSRNCLETPKRALHLIATNIVRSCKVVGTSQNLSSSLTRNAEYLSIMHSSHCSARSGE